jgi:K+-transporting ATPase ATPase C chain
MSIRMENGFIPNQIRATIVFMVCLSILLGLAYPGVVTLLLQTVFNDKANGSLLVVEKQVRGSWLIGQKFSQDHYFWSRPSALDAPYYSRTSGGSNLCPTNPTQFTLIQARVASLQASSLSSQLIPIDLVTASASGLDPHISLAAARYQIPRIAKARKIKEEEIQEIINQQCPNALWGFIGTAHLNVLKLNVDLDKVSQYHHGVEKT